MILQTFSGEVSEVSEDIFQVRNRRDVLNYDTLERCAQCV